MIGIFDSGIGGLCSLKEYRRLIPRESIIYLADRKNAPYGTKDRDTVLKLTKNNIKVLKDMGASRILIACCTASSVYGELNSRERAISFPIITPSAIRSLELGKRITVIATERTVASHIFENEIHKISKDATVTELVAQELVSMVERGARDGALTTDDALALDKLADRINRTEPKCLILGCTHFSYLEKELSNRIYPTITVNAAKLGAAKLAEERRKEETDGIGKIIFM